MSLIHTGNVVPDIMKEEHDGVLNAKRIVSAATVYAVVNTAAAGQSSVVLDTGANWIGLATVNVGNSLPAGTNAIGKLAANSGVDIGDVDVTSISAGANYIGLASVNVGGSLPSINGQVETVTSKTLVHLPIAGNTSGNATIFVPSGTFKITHLVLSAGATVGINIKSGPTYLVGNASLNMTLFPGGGWVENGQIDNPIYDGLADGGSLVIQTDQTAELAGKVVYYED